MSHFFSFIIFLSFVWFSPISFPLSLPLVFFIHCFNNFSAFIYISKFHFISVFNFSFRSFFVSSIVENQIIELPLLDETTKLEVTSTTEPQSFLEIVQSNVNQQFNDKQKVTTENPLNVLSTTNSNTSPRYAYVYR